VAARPRGAGSLWAPGSYFDEKADALQRLAAKIEAIIHPPEGNVIPLRAAAS
jgi:hypothetical protein